MKLFDFIKDTDFLGCKFPFRVEEDSKHKTYYGGFLSTVYYALFIYFSWYYIYSMFIVRIPQGFKQNIHGSFKNPEELNLTENPYVFGVSVVDSKDNNVNIQDLFFPIFVHKTMDRVTGDETSIRLNAIPCKEIVPETVEKGFYNLSNYLCPDFRNTTLKLKGDYSTNKLSIISFSYSICNHDINDFKCKNPQNLLNMFKRTTLWVSSLLPQAEYFINNYHQPYSIRIKREYEVLSPYKQTYDEYILSKQQAQSDYSVISSNPKNDFAVGLTKRTSYVKVLNEPLDIEKSKGSSDSEKTGVFLASIVLDNNVIFYSRVYKKIEDFLGAIVGQMKLLQIICVFLTTFYSNFKLKEFLFNHLIVIDPYIETSENKILTKQEANYKLRQFFSQGQIQSPGGQVGEIANNPRNNNDNYVADILQHSKNISEKKEDILKINQVNDPEDLASIKHENETQRIVPGISNSENPEKEKLKIEKEKDKHDLIKTDLKNKAEVRVYLEVMFEKFKEEYSKFTYSLFELFNYIVCGREKIRNTNKIINFYVKKILKRFDIFYYLKKFRTLKIIKKSIFPKEQVEIMKICSNKEYNIDLRDDVHKMTESEERKIESKTLDYVLNRYNIRNNNEEQKIMNYLIKLD